MFFIVPILIYFSGINSVSLGSDLSTIVSITIFASNFIKNKILEILKNFEIVMISAVLAASISIILSRGNYNYAATLLFLPLERIIDIDAAKTADIILKVFLISLKFYF